MLAAAIDGEAALRHASVAGGARPASLGLAARPAVAAQYVEAELRAAGLADVRLQPFTAGGIAGANVVGVLRGSGGPEFVVLGAHHDTAPDAPGAYDDGGGVGVLIETARVLARQGPARAHDRLRLVRRRGVVVDRQGQPDAGSRALPRVARAGRAQPGGRVRRRDVRLEGRPARLPPDRLRRPALRGPLRDHARLAGARGARRRGRVRRRRPVAVLALPAGACAPSASASTATTSRSCRPASRRSSPRTRRSPRSTRGTTSRPTPRTSSTRRRSRAWARACWRVLDALGRVPARAGVRAATGSRRSAYVLGGTALYAIGFLSLRAARLAPAPRGRPRDGARRRCRRRSSWSCSGATRCRRCGSSCCRTLIGRGRRLWLTLVTALPLAAARRRWAPSPGAAGTCAASGSRRWEIARVGFGLALRVRRAAGSGVRRRGGRREAAAASAACRRATGKKAKKKRR